MTTKLAPSFSKTCQGDWKTAARRANEGRRVLAQVRAVLLEIEQLELHYGTTIKRLAAALEVPKLESSGVRDAINAFKNDLDLQGTLSLQLATSLREDVLETNLNSAIVNHTKVYSDIESDALRQEEFLESVKCNRAERLIECVAATKEALDKTVEAQTKLSSPSKTKFEAFSRALAAIQEQETAEQKFDEHQRRLAIAEEETRKRYDSVLDSLEDMDRKRIACLRDSLLKTFVHRAGRGRQLEYNLNNSIQAVEGLNSDKEISEFLETCYGSVTPHPAADLTSEVDPLGENATSSNTAADTQTTGATVTLLAQPAPLPWKAQEQILPIQKELLHRHYNAVRNARRQSSDSIVNPVLDFLKRNPTLDEIFRQAKASMTQPRRPERRAATAASERSIVSSDDPVERPAFSDPSPTEERSLDELLTTSCEMYSDGQGFGSCEAFSTEAPKYSLLLDSLLTGNGEHLQNAASNIRDLERLIESFSGVLNRTAFSLLLIGKVINKPVNLASEACFQGLSFLLTNFLTWTEIQRDYWNTRIVLMACHSVSFRPSMEVINRSRPRENFGLSDLYELRNSQAPASVIDAGENDTPARCLTAGVYQHQIWNKIDFWSDSLITGVSEDKQKTFLVRAWSQAGVPGSELERLERVYKLYNPCYSTINNFGRYMKNFGIHPHQIIDLFQRTKIRFKLDTDYIGRLTYGLPMDAAEDVNQKTAAEEAQ